MVISYVMMFVQVGCGVSNWWFPVPFTLINDLYTQRLCFFYWWFGGVRQSIVMFFFFFFLFSKKKNYMELHFALYISSYAIIVSKEEKMRNFAKISVKFCVSVGPNGKLWMESRFPRIFVYFFFPNFPSFEILVHQTHHTAHPHDIQTLCILKKI